MAQGSAPLFLKGLHHAPGRGNEVCLGGGNHRFYLLDFPLRRRCKLDAFGPDSLVMELANLQTDFFHFLHHLRQLILHAVDIPHQGLHFFLLLLKVVFLQHGEKLDDLGMFPQRIGQFSHISFLPSKNHRAGSACFLAGGSSRQYSG